MFIISLIFGFINEPVWLHFFVYLTLEAYFRRRVIFLAQPNLYSSYLEISQIFV